MNEEWDTQNAELVEAQEKQVAQVKEDFERQLATEWVCTAAEDGCGKAGDAHKLSCDDYSCVAGVTAARTHCTSVACFNR